MYFVLLRTIFWKARARMREVFLARRRVARASNHPETAEVVLRFWLSVQL